MQSKTTHIAFAAVLLAITNGGVHAETLEVPYHFPTIEAAIENASYGDVVDIASGTYYASDSIDLNGKAITVRGAVDTNGSPTTIIVGPDSTRLFVCVTNESNSTVFENLRLEITSSGIYIDDASPTVKNCTFTRSEYWTPYSVGIGVLIWDSSNARILDCTFSALKSNFAAGVVFLSGYGDEGHVVVDGCTFEDNVGEYSGGLYATATESRITISNCTFEANTSETGGGLTVDECTDFEISNCTFTGNNATSHGGGLHVFYSEGVVQNCSITANTAGINEGGGLYIVGSENTIISNTEICGNLPDQWTSFACPYTGCWVNGGGNAISEECLSDCPADFNGDDVVSGVDLSKLIGHWGLGNAEYDLDDNGVLDGADLSILLSNWGACP